MRTAVSARAVLADLGTVVVLGGAACLWSTAARGPGRADATHAIEAWQSVVEMEPFDFNRLFNLGVVLTKAGRPAEARRHVSPFLAEGPCDRCARDLPRARGVLARPDNSL